MNTGHRKCTFGDVSSKLYHTVSGLIGDIAKASISTWLTSQQEFGPARFSQRLSGLRKCIEFWLAHLLLSLAVFPAHLSATMNYKNIVVYLQDSEGK